MATKSKAKPAAKKAPAPVAPTATPKITYKAAREKTGPKTELLKLVLRKGVITVKDLASKAEAAGINAEKVPQWVSFLANAPHSQHRAAVTPAQRGRGAPRPPASDAEPAKVSTPRHVAMSWARRLKRVCDVEIESCTRCGGS